MSKENNAGQEFSIMTPVFEGTSYRHHICSECKGTIKFEQNRFGGVSFYTISLEKCELMKFCPLCGKEIIKFSNDAIYEKPIDLKPLDIFAKLHSEYERKAKWLYHCYLSEAHRDKIDALIPLIKSGDVSLYYQKALDFAKMGKTYYGVSYQTKKKLRKEFGEDQE